MTVGQSAMSVYDVAAVDRLNSLRRRKEREGGGGGAGGEGGGRGGGGGGGQIGAASSPFMARKSYGNISPSRTIDRSAHCTLHTAHCTLHNAHCTLQTAHCILHTTHCALYTIQNMVNTHNVSCTIDCTILCYLSPVLHTKP